MGEHSIVEQVRQTCDEPCTCEAAGDTDGLEGVKSQSGKANKAVEGMTRTIMSCVATRCEVEVPTGHPVVQRAIPARS